MSSAMKLLNCIACQDIVLLHTGKDRTCLCGKSKGHYKDGGVLAVYSGPARIIGLRSLDYHSAEHGKDYKWWVIKDGNHVRKEEHS